MAFISENAAIIVVIGALALLAIGYALGRMTTTAGDDRGRLDQLPAALAQTARAAPAPTAQPGTLSPEALTRIQDALRAGNKIQAIKIMREATGLGLAEAKDAVEAMQR